MSKKSPRPLSELDRDSRKRIEDLTAREPHELSPDDRAFMRGRRDYLTEEQVEDYCGEVEVEEEETGDKYDAMNAAELKEELKKRELAVGGKVEELRARLREADAAAGE